MNEAKQKLTSWTISLIAKRKGCELELWKAPKVPGGYASPKMTVRVGKEGRKM